MIKKLTMLFLVADIVLLLAILSLNALVLPVEDNVRETGQPPLGTYGTLKK